MEITYQEIRDFTKELLEKEFATDIGPPPTVWHYTDLVGLGGTLSQRKLRLTNPFFLNDPGEIAYGENLAKNILEEIANEGDREAKKFRDEYLRFNEEEQFYEPHVFSFCEEGNDLNLWRTYGREGKGFAVGFDSGTLMTEIERIGLCLDFPPRVYLNRVVYRVERQSQLLQRLFEFSLDLYRRKGLSEADDLQKEKCFGLLFEQVAYFLPLIKSESYAGEREIRLVLHGHDVKSSHMEFTYPEGYFKPYLNLPYADDSTDRYPIRQITSGPRVDGDLFRRSIRILLAKYDLEHHRICIVPSGIAYRG